MKKVIGLDIGGTKITGIIFDGKNIVKELTIVTPKTLFEFQHSLGKLVGFLSFKEKINSIGVGMAGLVDPKKGVIISSPNIKYIKNFPLRKFLKEKGFKKVEADNDAACFMRAEFFLGQVKGNKNALAITLGTGIGGAFVINGKFYRGSNNLGGEIGKMSIANSTWESLFQKARDKNNNNEMSKLVAIGLGSLIKILDPGCVVFGGSVSVNQPKMIKKSWKLAQESLKGEQLETKVFISTLKNAGALGAALLIKN